MAGKRVALVSVPVGHCHFNLEYWALEAWSSAPVLVEPQVQEEQRTSSLPF